MLEHRYALQQHHYARQKSRVTVSSVATLSTALRGTRALPDLCQSSERRCAPLEHGDADANFVLESRNCAL